MIRRVDSEYVALLIFFTFCQVIGTMCALPDLSVAKETAILVEEGMVCPMDGTIMCPPSITSTPERQIQIKSSMVMDVDHVTIVFSSAAVLTAPSVSTQWSWSSAYSIVPISIDSSSVLRI